MSQLPAVDSARAAPVRVMLVDDHSLARAGIRRLLEDAPGVEVVAEFPSCDDAIRSARSLRPDLVLMDMSGVCLSVLDGSRRLQRQLPDIKVIILSADSASMIPERLLHQGVQGCLTKQCSESELLQAIDAVHRGERYLSVELAQQLAAKRLSGAPASPFEALTHRELQVMLLVSEGKSAAQIAQALCLTQKTINGYRNRVLEKLQVRTEVQLMHLALAHGVLELNSLG